MTALDRGEELLTFEGEDQEAWEDFLSHEPGDVLTFIQEGETKFDALVVRVDASAGELVFRRIAGAA